MGRSVRLMLGSGSSPWTDLDRPPLSPSRLRRALVGPGAWATVDVVGHTGSTNADLAAAARRGDPAPALLVAEEQSAGRGRMTRRWEAPARSGVMLSALLRPSAPTATWPLLPFIAGVAVAEAVRAVAEVDAVLKWPNDVLVGEHKLGGILVERVEDAVVVGIGVNVSLRADELPVPTATSLALAGGGTDREALTKEIARALLRRYDALEAASGASSAILPAYREICATIGTDVVVELPGGEQMVGQAASVDDDGALVVVTRDGEHRVTAGDVVHVRRGG